MKSTCTLAGTALAALLGWVQYAEAGTSVLVDGATAAALCATGYPGANSGGAALGLPVGHGRIHAGAAWARARGAGVKVGVIDGGVDFTHPDLAGAIDVGHILLVHLLDDTHGRPSGGGQRRLQASRPLSRTCKATAHTSRPPSQGRLNMVGIAGVAPDATVVGLKACTIAGFCFADSVAAALRYAGDKRLDVVNLSLFADPYLYFCGNDAEQRAILHDLQSAARYAQQRGVVVVASAGNEFRRPRSSGPRRDQPGLAAEHRRRAPRLATIAAWLRPSCPAWSPFRRPACSTLAIYSNVGSPVDVTAPGGDATQLPAAFGSGRILAGWSSSDQTGMWEALTPSDRARRNSRWRPVRVDQRHLDGVATRRRRRRPHPLASPGLPSSHCRRASCARRPRSFPAPRIGRPMTPANALAVPGAHRSRCRHGERPSRGRALSGARRRRIPSRVRRRSALLRHAVRRCATRSSRRRGRSGRVGQRSSRTSPPTRAARRVPPNSRGRVPCHLRRGRREQDRDRRRRPPPQGRLPRPRSAS